MIPRTFLPARAHKSLAGRRCLFALSVCSGAAGALRAGVVLEEVHLLARGWNLVHVGVEPLEKDPRVALSSIDWESVWTWIAPAAGSDPGGRGGTWLVVHRDAPAFLSTLGSFTGPNSYALLARSAGTLRVRGTLRLDRQPLRGGAFQLFGPGVSSTSPPSAASYFSRPGVSEHIGDIYELAAGAYRKLAAGDALRSGAAYWVRPAQDIPDPHPLRLGIGSSGLDFNPEATIQEIEIDIGAATGAGGGGGAEPRRLALGILAAVESPIPPDWLEVEGPGGAFVPLAGGVELDVDPEAARVRVAFRARHDGVLDEALRGAAAVELSGPSGSLRIGAELDLAVLEGIWTGEAVLDEVELSSIYGGGYAPAPTLVMSVILEIPEDGSPRLLPCIELDGLRDGRSATHRLEAALFHEAVDLAGSLAAGGKSGVLTGTLALPAEHPLNPHRHRYHPEHGRGYDVVRELALRFGAKRPAGAPESPTATVGVLTGTYEEELTGLAQETIRTRGSFQLRRLVGGSPALCATAGK